VFGVIVAMLAVLLLGPTTLEFWTKTAILASLVIACALRFALVALLEPIETKGLRWMFDGFHWRVPSAYLVALLCIALLPVAADLGTRSPQPFAELPDGSTPKITLTAGNGPATAVWVSNTAGAALPPAGNTAPAPASARVWLLPAIPRVSIASNVSSFDPGMNSKVAAKMAHDVVLDLVIESEARRSHDFKLAQLGASADALKEFTDVIKTDVAARTFVQKTYVFDRVSLDLYLPKFATQAPRLEGISLHGTAILTTRNAAGQVLSTSTQSYAKTWGLGGSPANSNGEPNYDYEVIFVDYTGLAPAP
jgi:hypothetical protein